MPTLHSTAPAPLRPCPGCNSPSARASHGHDHGRPPRTRLPCLRESSPRLARPATMAPPRCGSERWESRNAPETGLPLPEHSRVAAVQGGPMIPSRRMKGDASEEEEGLPTRGTAAHDVQCEARSGEIGVRPVQAGTSIRRLRTMLTAFTLADRARGAPGRGRAARAWRCAVPGRDGGMLPGSAIDAGLPAGRSVGGGHRGEKRQDRRAHSGPASLAPVGRGAPPVIRAEQRHRG